ncbi:YaiI/YqxD family protein [Desertibacillus haloalkaliphilus]|uniref:YaiI/YqxD family protein n=1 Tax=Desertibacillus haloalkaliphilus TaxID=1328930 RepID=UPI001FE85F7F|nr:YaiI/YqxD family protein [Desertibacillus haloalkaliphilus]
MKRNIWVDADSCPVKEEVITIATEYEEDVVFISSYAHHVTDPRVTNSIVVDSEREAVDLYIVNHVKADDIVITQDHALAGILLPRGAKVISPRGIIFTEADMPQLLEFRHASKKQRRAGKKTSGPKKFSEQDRQTFCRTLRKILSKKEGL